MFTQKHAHCISVGLRTELETYLNSISIFTNMINVDLFG